MRTAPSQLQVFDSKIVGNAELARILRINFGWMLGDVLHHGAARAALQKRVEAGELFGGADGVDFHTAVAKIANKTGQSEVFGFVLGKVAEADTLHDSGNKIAACDLVGGH
jgi:hypothetical protein